MCVSNQQQRSSSVDASSQLKDGDVPSSLGADPMDLVEPEETFEESPRPRRKAAMNAAKMQFDHESEEEEEEEEGIETRPRRKAKSSPRPKYPHLVTQHNYHDRSCDPIADGDLDEAHTGCRGRGKGGVNVSFPVKLYEMLHRVEEEGLGHIVSFQPHGRCFVVHEVQDFKEILPNYFKVSCLCSRISSFNDLYRASYLSYFTLAFKDELVPTPAQPLWIPTHCMFDKEVLPHLHQIEAATDIHTFSFLNNRQLGSTKVVITMNCFYEAEKTWRLQFSASR